MPPKKQQVAAPAAAANTPKGKKASQLQPTTQPQKQQTTKSEPLDTTATVAPKGFSTTASGLIQYTFDSDSDNDYDAPTPIPKHLQEDLTQTVSNNLGDMGMNDHEHYDEMNTRPGSKRQTVIKNTIDSKANLIRKAALAAKQELKVVNPNTTEDAAYTRLYNDKFDGIKAGLVREFRKKRFGLEYDSDDSDFAEEFLPVLDSDDDNRLSEKAKQMATTEAKKSVAEKNKLVQLGNKALSPPESDDEEAAILKSLSAREKDSYRQAAEALEFSSDDDVDYSDDESDDEKNKKLVKKNKINERVKQVNKKLQQQQKEERFGDSDLDDEADEEEDDLETKLNKDVFETQTSAFTTDENGVLVQVNHNISFSEMFLSKPMIISLQKNGFTKPTPIQAASVPVALKGYDIMANAVTGSGKTVAFLLPILERLTRMPQRSRCIRAVIVTPTRELAEQIFRVAVGLAKFCPSNISLSCIFGGVNMASQETELRQSPDIVICTPGRMIDHLTNTSGVSIDRCEVLVLDEADRLLDMGFRDEVQHIIDMSSKNRQTLLFSATINNDVDELIKQSLRGYKRVLVDKASSIVTTLTQQFIRLRHDNETLRQAIVLSLCRREFKNKTIIFVKTKQHAQQLNVLFQLCGLDSGELHGDLSQTQRSDVLERFRKQKLNYLIATDIASRGLDIKGVMTVINLHLPINYNSYVHRVGRTARAGEKGTAISLVSEFDRKLLREMMKVHDMGNDEDPFKPKSEDEKSKKEKMSSNKNLLLNLKKREIAAPTLEKYTKKIHALQPHVDKLIEELKNTRNLDLAERDLIRAENLLKHQDSIQQRPKREWFQTGGEKAEAKQSVQDAYKEAQRDRQLVKGISAKLQEIRDEDKADENDKKKKKDKNDLRGLSRTEKRRKLFKLDQEQYASELRHELATSTSLTDKQRKDKHNEITSILKPQITAAFVKRKMRREGKEQVAQDKANFGGEDHDGAGPQSFIKYAKKFDQVKTISNARKRKAAEAQLDNESYTKNRRYADTSSAQDAGRKRFQQSMAQYDKKTKNMEQERKDMHKAKHSGFKSATRYRRR